MAKTKRKSIDNFMKIRLKPEPLPNDFTKSIGEKIQEARQEYGLSQAQLAKEIKSRQSTISDIEKGKNEIGVFMLSSIALVLRKPIDYFFPPIFVPNFKATSLTEEEEELLTIFKRLEYYVDTDLVKGLMESLADYYSKLPEEEN